MFVYLASEDPESSPTKIGHSTNPRFRLADHKRSTGLDLEMQHIFKTDSQEEAEDLERRLLNATAKNAFGKSEWRSLSATELFRIAESLTGEIEEVDLPSGRVRTTIDLPRRHHELLRRIAFEERCSQKQVWLDALELFAHAKGY